KLPMSSIPSGVTNRRATGADNHTFNRLRRRLEKIACRMLGSLADAEDVVQDAWLRWNEAAGPKIDNEEAWLVSVTRRLCIDRLRTLKIQRECCSELWQRGSQMTDLPATPQEINERADDMSMAYLALLERLSHEARAAFLMHEIFDTDYDQIAKTLHKNQVACRQLVSRAKIRLRGEQPRFTVSQETYHYLLSLFVQALHRGSPDEIS